MDDLLRRHCGPLSRIACVVGLLLAFLATTVAQEQEQEPAAPSTVPLILDIKVEGNSTVDTNNILSVISAKPGRPYYEDEVKQDIQSLWERRWFYDVTASVDRKPDGVILIFKVAERPIIQEVLFLGAHKYFPFTEKKLREMTDLRPGKSMDPNINRAAAKQLERSYHDKGYPFATVELEEGGEYGDKRVVLRINQGPKTRITDIEFEGANFVPAGRLKTFIKNKEAWGSAVGVPFFMGLWKEDGIEEDKVALIEYYRSFGFLDVKVGREVDWTEDKSQVRIRYKIEEGPRYKVRNVQIVGNKVFDNEKLSTGLKLTSGKTLERDVLEKDVEKIKETYGSQGYVFAAVNVEQRVTETPGEVDLYYQVSEDLPRKIGRINIEGNEITKERIVTTIAGLEPGQLADSTELKKAQQRLANSRIFDVNPQGGIQPVVEFDPNNDPSSEFQDIRVRVQEAQTGSLMLGAGVNSNSGVGGSLVINERNFDLFAIPTSWADIREGRAFRGAGQELRIEAIPGTQVNRYSVTFREPRLFGSTYSLTNSGYYYTRWFRDWNEQRIGGRFALGKQFTRTIGGSLTYRVEQVDIFNPTVPTPPDLQEVLGKSVINSARVGFSHDTRDSNLRPSEGHFVEVAYEQAFGEYTFPRGTIEGRQYWTVHQRADGSGKHILAARGELGISGSNTPIFERFYAGGFGSLRGFQFRGVSPLQDGIQVGGDFIMLTSLEYQFPFTHDDSFGGALFVDAGTVESDFGIQNYRVAPGFGIRIAIPGMGPVPLAFDFAFPVVTGPGDDEQVFAFSVGWFN